LNKLRANCLEASNIFENEGNVAKVGYPGNEGACNPGTVDKFGRLGVGKVGNLGRLGRLGVGELTKFGSDGLGKLGNKLEKLGMEGRIEGNEGMPGKLGNPGSWKSKELKPIVFTDIESTSTEGFGFASVVVFSTKTPLKYIFS